MDPLRQRTASGYFSNDSPEKNEWLQLLQLELGGSFTWATNESEEGFSINNERFIISGLLGEGSFGSVYRCSCEGHQMAVKILSTERIAMMTNNSQDLVLRRVLQEAEILGCLGGHPNIVQLRCAAVSQETLRIYIVMQLLECSDLFTEMLRRRQPFSERNAREAVAQLVMAVMHCHRRGVAHRDIKLENVMVASVTPFVIKLIDFGQAIVHDQRTQHMRSMAKTLTTTSVYTPPECQAVSPDDLNYDPFKLDCFAVGVVLYALLISAWPQTNTPGEFEKHPSWKKLSSPVQDLIRGLLEPDPLKRLSMADALQHPWLANKTMSTADTRSSNSCTPKDQEAEMEVLLAAQSLAKALQRERGASCWMISGHADAESLCMWFRKSTDEIFDSFEEKFAKVNLDNLKVDVQLTKLREFTTRLRGGCSSRSLAPDALLQKFDEVFSGYCKLNEELIDLIGNLLAAFRGGTEPPVTVLELKIRMLLHMAEQLGRERGFMSFHIGTQLIQSANAQLRFAKIQGCRQYLVGSSSPYLQCEVVSHSSGLLPSLRLADEPILSTSEIQALERAEDSVMQGRKDTSEWFTLVTSMIDKVHQHVSMSVVLFIGDLARSQSEHQQQQQPRSEAAWYNGAQIHSSATSECGLQSTPSAMGSLRGSAAVMGSGGSRRRLGSGTMGSVDGEQAQMLAEAKRLMSPTEKYASLLQAAAILKREEENVSDLGAPGLSMANGGCSASSMSGLAPPPFLEQKETVGLGDLGALGLAMAGSNVANSPNGRSVSTPCLGLPPFLSQKEQTPVKVMPLSTPEATPIHPGLWSGRGSGLPGPYSLAGGPLHNLPCFPIPSMVPSQCPQPMDFKPFLAPPMAPQTAPGAIPQVPQVPQPSTPTNAPRSVVVSKGTIGHPHSCRGLGCKFASKERGCREGADCPRCHLCVWSRASEKEAANQAVQ